MLSCAVPSGARAVERAAVSSAIRARLLTCAWNFVIFEKTGSCSSPGSRRADRGAAVSGVTTTTGECAQNAAAVDVTKFVMPGPFCAMQTPWRRTRSA